MSASVVMSDSAAAAGAGAAEARGGGAASAAAGGHDSEGSAEVLPAAPAELGGFDPLLAEMFLGRTGLPEGELGSQEQWAAVQQALKENPLPAEELRDVVRKHILNHQRPQPTEDDHAAMAGRERSQRRAGLDKGDAQLEWFDNPPGLLSPSLCVRSPHAPASLLMYPVLVPVGVAATGFDSHRPARTVVYVPIIRCRFESQSQHQAKTLPRLTVARHLWVAGMLRQGHKSRTGAADQTGVPERVENRQ